MKKHFVLIVSCFLFLLVYFELDIIYSLFFRNQNNLNEEVVLKSEYEELEKKYLELSSQLGLEEEQRDRVLSKVVVHNPYLFFDEVTILKGKEEGVEVGDIVYDEKGYIGKIIETRRHSSIVELVTSARTVMPVKIQNSYGVLQKEKDGLVVKNITSKEKILIGSVIETSEFSNIGILLPIGVVTDVEDNGIEQVLKIEPLLDVNTLNYCFIKKEVSYD